MDEIRLRLAAIEEQLATIEMMLHQALSQQAVQDRLLSMDEAAEMLGISRRTLHDRIELGELRATRIGRRRMLSLRQLDAYIRSKTK